MSKSKKLNLSSRHLPTNSEEVEKVIQVDALITPFPPLPGSNHFEEQNGKGDPNTQQGDEEEGDDDMGW